MSEHTPGPWKLIEHDGAGRNFVLKRKFWEVGGGPEAKGVAFVFGDDEANAKLIASAPDLLAERDRLKAENRRLNEALDGLEAKWRQAASDMDSIGVGAWQPEVRQCADELREARAAIQTQQEGEWKT